MTKPSRPVELVLDGPCELSCAGLCDCRRDSSDPRRVEKALTDGGTRLTLRGGGAAGHSRLPEYIGRARDAGFGEIVVRTNALAFAPPDEARAFARRGIDGVIVPVFSQHAPVHDRIAGRPGALVQALVAMRSLHDAGVAIEIETPLLAPRLQDPAAVVELVHRAVPSLRSVRFYLPRAKVADALAPPDWTDGAPALARAIDKCNELGVAVSLRNADAIPLCALRDFPRLLTAHRFNPKVAGQKQSGCALPEPCERCVARPQCAGVSEAYLARHGTKGIHPWDRKPLELYEQRTTPGRRWDEAQREAARRANLLVLRPTVNCNQDCTFCSANETSNNVWPDSEQMFRVIARAARRGVKRVAFSGGDPTLSKDLVRFIRVAKRTGVPEIEIVTNGVLLDRAEKVQALREAGLTHAFVSLHAHAERLSRVLTQKVGDFDRTMKAIRHLRDAGVVTVINHVVNAKNYRFLKRFVELVRNSFDGGTMISFAFVTPQYKALENLDLLPRLSDVRPYLHAALHAAVELGQPFIVGSRQGVPPCFLGPFRGWSDVFDLAHEAMSEDSFQKAQGPQCGECRYRQACTGLWKPYVARFGFDELEPIRGEPFTNEELHQISIKNHPPPWGVPLSFDGVHPLVRDHDAEGRTDAALEEPQLESFSLPTLDLRTRPVRVAMAGTGRQARRLARSLRQVRGLSLDAVASPHAPDGDLLEFGNCPAYRSAAEALDDVRPEALVIAAATNVHATLAKEALERGIPALVEKPLARTEEEGEELVNLARTSGVLLMPALNDLFAPGLERIFEAGPHRRVTWTRRCPPTAPEAMRAWSRAPLFEVLHHAISVVGRAAGGGVGTVTATHTRGSSIPELVRVQLQFGETQAEVVLDFTSNSDDLTVTAEPAAEAPELTWRRAGREVTFAHGTQVSPVESDGGEIERMLAHFRDVVLGKATPLVHPAEALDVMRTTRACIEALEANGTPFQRPNAPKHVKSRPELQVG